MIRIDEFRGMLRINKHDLDNELIQQAEVQEHIARELAWRVKQLAESKDIMESIEHDKVNAAKEAVAKLTVEQAKGEARKSAAWRAARSNYQNLQQNVSEWEAVLEAWKSRGFQLKTLADLFVAAYFDRDSVQVKSDRQSLRNAVNAVSSPIPRRR